MARNTTGMAYLTVGLTILGVLVFTVFVTVPAWSEWRGVLAEEEGKKVELAKKLTFLTDIDARAAELATLERDERTLGVLFPATEAPADLLASLQAIASRSGVRVHSLSVQEEASSSAAPQGGSGVRRTARLSVRGSYGQVRAFVSDLERSPRFLDIPEVEIVEGKEGEAGAGAAFVEGNLTIWSTLVPSAGTAVIGGMPLPAPESAAPAEPVIPSAAGL